MSRQAIAFLWRERSNSLWLSRTGFVFRGQRARRTISSMRLAASAGHWRRPPAVRQIRAEPDFRASEVAADSIGSGEPLVLPEIKREVKTEGLHLPGWVGCC